MASLMMSALTIIGPKLGSAAASWVFKQGVDAVFGKETDQIRDDIRNVSAKVDKVQQSVDGIARQLPQHLMTLRKDNLDSYVGKINTKHLQVNLVLLECADSAGLSAAKREAKLKDIRLRLLELLTQIKNELPECLGAIHRFLTETGDKSILQLARDKSHDASLDFISYYLKMQAFISPLWLAEMKGLYLLQIAADAPGVYFMDGPGLISTFVGPGGHIAAQQAHFNNVVGPYVITLYNHVMKYAPYGYIPIRFRTGEGHYISDRNEDILIRPCVAYLGTGERSFFLKPTTEIHENMQPNASYYFNIVYDGGDIYLRVLLSHPEYWYRIYT